VGGRELRAEEPLNPAIPSETEQTGPLAPAQAPRPLYLRATEGCAPGTLAPPARCRGRSRQLARIGRRPVVYADDNVPAAGRRVRPPPLARLEAANKRRPPRHAAPGRNRRRSGGNPAPPWMRLLASCTKHGVAVELLGPSRTRITARPCPGDAPRPPAARSIALCALLLSPESKGKWATNLPVPGPGSGAPRTK